MGIGNKDFGHIATILSLIERSYQFIQALLVGFFCQRFNLFKSGVSQTSPDSFQRNDFRLSRAFSLMVSLAQFDISRSKCHSEMWSRRFSRIVSTKAA